MTEWRRAAAHVVAAAAYVAAARVGLLWSVPDTWTGFAWPAAGLGLAIVLRWGPSLLVTLLVAGVAVRLAAGAPPAFAVVAALGETLEIALAAWLLHRIAGIHIALDRTRDVIVFVLLGAGVSTIVGTLAVVAGLVVVRIVDLGEVHVLWWRWWLAHGVGVLIATPPAIAWTARPPELRLSSRRVEGVVTMAVLIASGLLAFSSNLQRPASLILVFASYPLLLLVALRQSLRWTSVGIVTLAALAIAATAARHGAFTTGNVGLELVLVWGYVITTSSMALLLGAAVAEARTADARTARLAAIMEATSDFVSTADPSGRLLWINAAGRRMVGLPNDATVGNLRIADLHPPWASELAVTTSIPHATEAGLWEGETALRHRDGHVIPVSQVIVAHRDRHGELEYLSTVIRDLSERRRLEAELVQAQKMEGIGRLAGGVAHDFNNVLTAIMGYIDLASQHAADPDRVRTYLEPVRTSAERASRLVRQLLAFARKQVLVPKTVDLNELMAETVPLVRSLLLDRVELDVRATSPLPPVRIDPVQFEQVVVNLAMNARDAMPNGGRLVLATDHVVTTGADPGHAGVPAGRWVRLTVEDEGTGMPEDVLRRAFEPFFTTKPIGEGTGLGLSMVHGSVRQHGGHITCESHPGQGTVFRIYLPEA